MKTILLVGAVALLSGCMTMTSNLQPVNEKVAAANEGQDCVNNFFGFGFGTNRIEAAMKYAYPKPITNVRSVELQTFHVLFIGGQCLIVKGEHALPVAQASDLSQFNYYQGK